MAVRLIALVVLAVCVVAGIWLGAGGDERMRLFTAVIFGLCALSIAWKLWSSRGEAGPGLAGLPPAPPAVESDPEPDEPAPSGPWTVYGHDTFAREDYFVGEFDTEAEAREFARGRLEELARFQDEALRDEIWVEPPDSEFRKRRRS
jgi:hypothetical protein